MVVPAFLIVNPFTSKSRKGKTRVRKGGKPTAWSGKRARDLKTGEVEVGPHQGFGERKLARAVWRMLQNHLA